MIYLGRHHCDLRHSSSCSLHQHRQSSCTACLTRRSSGRLFAKFFGYRIDHHRPLHEQTTTNNPTIRSASMRLDSAMNWEGYSSVARLNCILISKRGPCHQCFTILQTLIFTTVCQFPADLRKAYMQTLTHLPFLLRLVEGPITRQAKSATGRQTLVSSGPLCLADTTHSVFSAWMSPWVSSGHFLTLCSPAH